MVLETQHWVGLDADDVQRAGVCTMDDLFAMIWPDGVQIIQVYDGELGNIKFGIGVIYDPSEPESTDDTPSHFWSPGKRALQQMDAAVAQTVPPDWLSPLLLVLAGHETVYRA